MKTTLSKLTGFTLVELIVVITILAILATIGFVSFSGYLSGTRDTNRIAQLKSMSDALELYTTKKDLPIPDDKVDIQASGTTIAYQGYMGANVLETIEYTEKGLDPKDKGYFSYYLTKDKKYFQLLSFLEEPIEDTLAGVFNHGQAIDYSGRYPKVTGKKLGILTDTSNTPIQEIAAVTSSGYLNISNLGSTTYKAIVSDDFSPSGTGSSLALLENLILSKGKIMKSCKDLLENNNNLLYNDGVYVINPSGIAPLAVYCDMTTDGGGWTFFAHFDAGAVANNFFEGFGNYKSLRDDDGTIYSLSTEYFEHTEMMVSIVDKDPSISNVAGNIVFFNYSQGDSGFNIGPVTCSGLTNFAYKTQINGSYLSGGNSTLCNTVHWQPKNIGGDVLIALRTDNFSGTYVGPGLAGTDGRYKDSWWYLR